MANIQQRTRGKVVAVSISDKKGERKTPVDKVTLVENFGIEGDAHAGSGITRQVSLLAQESVDKMIAMGLDVGPGAFAENVTTKGIELVSLPLGTTLKIGRALGEVSQIGKECHDRCNIYKQVGDCIMPREGIFIKVIQGGRVRPGDKISVLEEG